MTVYLFITKLLKNIEYDELPDMGDILSSSDKYDVHLYAFTTKKKLKKLFEKSRNMDLFKLVEKDMSDEEYEMFLDEYGEAELIEDYLQTKNKDSGTASVVITKRESDIVTCTPELILDSLMSKVYGLSIGIPIERLPMRKKIINALITLGIPQIESIIYGDDNNPEWLSDSGMKLDELELFVNEFYETIKA